MRAVVHLIAQGVVVAGRCEPALGDDEHVGSESGDLVEHVAGDQQAGALRGEFVEEGDHALSLYRVEAGERLVEYEHGRVVDDGSGELGPLPHALRERADGFWVVGVEIDPGDRLPGSGVGLGGRQPMGEGGKGHEVEHGEPVEEGVLLRCKTDAPADLAIGAGVFAEHVDRAA